MLTYEYRCTKCEHVFDCLQRVGEPAPACPVCGSPTRKVYSSVGLIFKGKGFHTTDYRKPAPSEDGEGKAAEVPSGKGAGEASETKKDASATKDAPTAKDASTTKDAPTKKDASASHKPPTSKGGST